MWLLQTTERSEAGPFTFRLTSGAVKTIGRSTTADFILDAAMVSRFHCRVTVEPDGQVELEDLESTNGTFVNGERSARATLKSGDTIRVGEVELVFREDARE
jgi:pSer/pThr/pTyr-binding forkhead associated (FHA) protein